jgi:hypothetical protein
VINKQPDRNTCRRSAIRNCIGANQMEFAAVFAVLILFIVMPLINLAAIPIRMAFANAAVKDTVHKLALSSKFSQAISTLFGGTLLKARLDSITGVSLATQKLTLISINSKGAETPFGGPGTISKNCLPDGESGPYRYNLELACEMDISPLFTMEHMGDIPGLTGPFRAHFREVYAWENLSKDPSTQQFYLNE